MATTYHGKSGAILQPGGELVTDRKGLVTGRFAFKVRAGAWGDMPQLNSVHPYALFASMERRVVRFEKGFWLVLGDYAGCEVEESEPAYDFNPGTGNEPIVTHDDFLTKIGGKPSAPLNGAIFRDQSGNVTTDDAEGSFDRFKLLKDDGTLNPWAGTEEFLTANNTVFTKSWTRRTKPAGASKPLQVVDQPPGGKAPTFDGANYKWLEFPVAYSVRGSAYDCRQMWMLSGPRGWNRVVYNGAEAP
jgi:hypothetical protein